MHLQLPSFGSCDSFERTRSPRLRQLFWISLWMSSPFLFLESVGTVWYDPGGRGITLVSVWHGRVRIFGVDTQIIIAFALHPLKGLVSRAP